MNDEEFELIPIDPVDNDSYTMFREQCERANWK